jgi:hypothetical protein
VELQSRVAVLFPRATFAAPLVGASVYCAEQGIRLAIVCAHNSAAHEHIPALYWTEHEVSSPVIIPYAVESCASREVIVRLARRGPKSRDCFDEALSHLIWSVEGFLHPLTGSARISRHVQTFRSAVPIRTSEVRNPALTGS